MIIVQNSFSSSGLSTSGRVTTSSYTVPTMHSPSEPVVQPSSISPSIKPVSCGPGQHGHHHHPVTSLSGVPSSLCRLLLDPQLGPSEPTISCNLNIRSPLTPLTTPTPVSPGLGSVGRTRRSSGSGGTKKALTKPAGCVISFLKVADTSGYFVLTVLGLYSILMFNLEKCPVLTKKAMMVS